MENYEEFLKGIREDFYESIEMSANPNLLIEFKELAYSALINVSDFIRKNEIDLENPKSINEIKKKALEELIPEIKKMKSLLEEALSPVGIPISSIRN